MPLKSKSSELTAALSLERLLKRFSLRPLEGRRRDAGRIRRFERMIMVRFWRSVCTVPCQGQRVGTSRDEMGCGLSYPGGQVGRPRLEYGVCPRLYIRCQTRRGMHQGLPQ